MVQHLAELKLRPASDKSHAHDQRLAKAIADASDHVMKVNAVSGGRVILQDLAGNVFDEPYCRLGNAVFASGDLVLVSEIRGWAPDVSPSDLAATRIVIDRVMTDPAPAIADIVGKLLLADLDPTGAATNFMVFFNGTAWAARMHIEPRENSAKQDTADVSPTTASATYQNAMTFNWSLPSGTWTIYADGLLDVERASAPLSVNLRLSINGTADPSPSTVTVAASPMLTKSTNYQLAGVGGGSIPIVLQYKGSSGSGITTTAESPRLALRALRTA